MLGEGEGGNRAAAVQSEHILLLEVIPEDAPQWFQCDVNQVCFQDLLRRPLIFSAQTDFHNFLGFLSKY